MEMTATGSLSEGQEFLWIEAKPQDCFQSSASAPVMAGAGWEADLAGLRIVGFIHGHSDRKPFVNEQQHQDEQDREEAKLLSTERR